MGKIPPLEAAASDVTKRFVILGNFREMHEFVDIEIAVRRFQIQLAFTSCHIYGSVIRPVEWKITRKLNLCYRFFLQLPAAF